jgi:hypothetical protein
MKYAQWFEEFAKKHETIAKNLSHLDREDIIDYFDFDNMKVAHPNFCPQYRLDQKCHDTKRLNCYFCGCMHFRFNDNGISDSSDAKRVYSYCSINSKDGKKIEIDKGIHNDCSMCKIPHEVSIIKEYFSSDWREVMRDCPI